MTLTTLKTRLEEASGPSRELDMDIAEILGALVSFSSDGDETTYRVRWPDEGPRPRTLSSRDMKALPTYTASVDAALELVSRKLPEFNGYMINRYETDKGNVRSRVSLLRSAKVKGGDTWDVWGETTPLAILIALTSALIAEEKT